jgi:SAM-dependent methyltransferase
MPQSRAVSDINARPLIRDAPRPRGLAVRPTAVPLPAYTADAGLYDVRTEIFQGYRDRIVAALELGPGDALLDVGCGTGLCFAELHERVGTGGSVVGIDESPDMVQLARERVARREWGNVSVVLSSVERAEIPVVAEAALFCAVHDVLQSFDALRNVFEHLRPGAQVVAGGGKLAAPWMVALNMQVVALHRPYVHSFEGFARPWAKLECFLEDLRVTEFAMGTGYCAVGRVRASLPRHVSGRTGKLGTAWTESRSH